MTTKCVKCEKRLKSFFFANYKTLKMRKMSLTISNRQLVKKCKVGQNGIEGNEFFFKTWRTGRQIEKNGSVLLRIGARILK